MAGAGLPRYVPSFHSSRLNGRAGKRRGKRGPAEARETRALAMDPLRVLYVEDNPADARLAQELLQEACPGKFHVEAVERFASAVERLEGKDFDVVLLDLRLPDGGGIDLVHRLLRVAPDTTLVVLTALADDGLAEASLQSGAQDYFVKTNLSGPGLARCLRYAVVRRQIEEELGLPWEVTHRVHAVGQATKRVRDELNYCLQEVTRLVREAREAAADARETRCLDAILGLCTRARSLVRELGVDPRRPRWGSPQPSSTRAMTAVHMRSRSLRKDSSPVASQAWAAARMTQHSWLSGPQNSK